MRLKGKIVVEPSNGSFDTYCSGVDQKQRGCRDVGFILSEILSECVNGYDCVSPRLLWLRIEIGLARILILGVYPPRYVQTARELLSIPIAKSRADLNPGPTVNSNLVLDLNPNTDPALYLDTMELASNRARDRRRRERLHRYRSNYPL
ncbi:hypothetical protein EVAR_64544_1 [Eumeta japonica]|uniref:Uncharacterized protein n=1 Tax=Eumeta variegata TaxID=151549 RepID=A0A4C1ZVX0_EUMVA|nr:hypothetical protein EVAR_64544_1 [Eumeta japonica]